MLRGAVNHLDLTVTDPQRSAAFYDAVLGYLGFERVRLAHDDACVWHSTVPGQRLYSIALQPARSGASPHDRKAPGLHHVAFEAESREDVEGLHALLLAAGAEVLDAPAEYPEYAPAYYAVFFADPDGLKLEFVHMPHPPEVAT